jgi:pimeloyl-ACP methyl ester carboxylesterase
MRIVAIVGIWNFSKLYRPIWSHFECAFKKRFPGATFEVEDIWYSPWQGKKMRAFADEIVKKYDDGNSEEILLLGYSMGGTIAVAIAPRFKNARIREVVTVWAPHTLLWGLFSWMLGARLQGIAVPVVSCRARFDYLVLWGARYPKATKHICVTCDHLLGLLISKRPAQVIADASVLQ